MRLLNIETKIAKICEYPNDFNKKNNITHPIIYFIKIKTSNLFHIILIPFLFRFEKVFLAIFLTFYAIIRHLGYIIKLKLSKTCTILS